MMDFYERQDGARKKTRLLVLYFVTAIVLLVAAINTVVFVLARTAGAPADSLAQWLKHPYWLYVSGVTLLIILGGSLIRLYKLRRGGTALASLVKARPVSQGTGKLEEKRLIHVVEELSIASGMPVPDLYVMDQEQGINAFVAGYNPANTVLVVTRGALDGLNRDELQGVIGHEFSHIFNGDMRINLRLIGILSGILIIGQLGMFILRSTRFRSSIGQSRERAGGHGLILALGLALAVLGYIGLFFGRLIKAAISRQREFLADASSIQLTRYPAGLAGALAKIRNHLPGSRMVNRHAEEMSHMCFAETVTMGLQKLFATHPPLDDRIRAIDPAFLGEVAKGGPTAAAAMEIPVGIFESYDGTSMGITATASTLTDSVGNHGTAHMDYAARLHHHIPDEILQALRSARGAKVVVYSLFLPEEPKARTAAMGLLGKREGPELAEQVAGIAGRIHGLGPRARLPLIDVALPALKTLTKNEVESFLRSTAKLITGDMQVTLSEYVLQTLLRLQLKPKRDWADKVKFRSFDPVLAHIALLLSLVAHTGATGPRQSSLAYGKMFARFTEKTIPQTPASQCTVRKLNDALNRLVMLSPLLKRPLLNACADLVLWDGRIRVQEAELLRAIAKSLDCPMPPLVPRQE